MPVCQGQLCGTCFQFWNRTGQVGHFVSGHPDPFLLTYLYMKTKYCTSDLMPFNIRLCFVDATNDWTDEERWSQTEACHLPEQLTASEGDAHQPRRLGWAGHGASGPGRGGAAGPGQRNSQSQETRPEQQADALLPAQEGARQRL